MKVLVCQSHKVPALVHILPLRNITEMVIVRGSGDRAGRHDLRIATVKSEEDRKVFGLEFCQFADLEDDAKSLQDCLPFKLPLEIPTEAEGDVLII